MPNRIKYFIINLNRFTSICPSPLRSRSRSLLIYSAVRPSSRLFAFVAIVRASITFFVFYYFIPFICHPRARSPRRPISICIPHSIFSTAPHFQFLLLFAFRFRFSICGGTSCLLFYSTIFNIFSFAASLLYGNVFPLSFCPSPRPPLPFGIGGAERAPVSDARSRNARLNCIFIHLYKSDWPALFAIHAFMCSNMCRRHNERRVGGRQRRMDRAGDTMHAHRAGACRQWQTSEHFAAVASFGTILKAFTSESIPPFSIIIRSTFSPRRSSPPLLQPRLRSLLAVAISFPLYIDRICFDLAYIRVAIFSVLPLRFLFSRLLPARLRRQRNDKNIIFFAIFHIGFIHSARSGEEANEFAVAAAQSAKSKTFTSLSCAFLVSLRRWARGRRGGRALAGAYA